MRNANLTLKDVSLKIKDILSCVPDWENKTAVFDTNGVEIVLVSRTADKVIIGRKDGKAVFVLTYGKAGFLPHVIQPGIQKVNRVGFAWRDERIKATAGLLVQMYFEFVLKEYGAAVTATHYTEAGRNAARAIASEVLTRGYEVFKVDGGGSVKIETVDEWDSAIDTQTGDIYYVAKK